MTEGTSPVLRPLESIEDVDAAIASTEPVILFKHSPACGTSSRARRQVIAFADERPDVPVYEVDVLQARPVSRYIAERFGIRHHSPQALIVLDGRSTWNGSHFRVTARALGREIDRL